MTSFYVPAAEQVIGADARLAGLSCKTYSYSGPCAPLNSSVRRLIECIQRLTIMAFDYSLDFKGTDFRKHPELYRIGRGGQGVLLVEPYKSEILPH